MNILLICDEFFGYAAEIKKTIESRGHTVHWYGDRHSNVAIHKFFIRVRPGLVRKHAVRHLERIIDECRGRAIDQVLVIKGEGFTPAMLARLRDAFPDAYFTLYFWDSYRNMPRDSRDKVPIFDRALSFDVVDTREDPRLQFRPLFYLDDYRRLSRDVEDIDVLFIGTIHSDRYAVLQRIAAALPPSVEFRRVMYFASGWIYRLRSMFDPSFRGARRADFIFTSLSKSEVMNLIARARIVVDIERAVQTGLTIRSIEMLGASKKLITTNASATRADFYRPENILVVDREAPVIDPAFLDARYVPVDTDQLADYSLERWVDEVLPASIRPEVGHPAAEAPRQRLPTASRAA